MSVAKPDHAATGIVALVVLTLVYGLTAVMARYFSESVGIFEQWYVRFFIAAIVMLIVFWNKIDISKFFRVSRKEMNLVLVRGFVGFVVAAGLYALSTLYATIGSVAVMQVVPTTALFGVIILHEKLTRGKVGIITVSFVGALMVLAQSVQSLSFGFGEFLSLIAGALFSLTFVLRKLQTGELNNYELAFGTTVVGAVGNYMAAGLFENSWLPQQEVFTHPLGIAFIGAGILSVMMSLLSHYGFEHVKATTGSVILDMELVFGVILGYLLYEEVLTPLQFLGAFIILVSAIAMSYLETRNKVIAPMPE